MSRLAKTPIFIPENVKIKILSSVIIVIGVLGKLQYDLNKYVKIEKKDNLLFFNFRGISSSYGWMQAGTCRANIQTMIVGVSQGFTKKLQLLGIGYRAIMESDRIIKLFLGFSHPIFFYLPSDIKAEILSQNEIVITGLNKQLVGQVAANIRSYRVPEPYKGKGIRYFNEKVRIKEAKKK